MKILLVWILRFWFWSYTPSIVISLSFWIGLIMGHLLLFFLYNFCSFFSYVGGVLIVNLFSLLLIDRYILAIQQIITHEKHLRYSFWSVGVFWTASEASPFFVVFDVCSVRPVQIFQVQAKISTLRPVFPDYLSVSLDATLWTLGSRYWTLSLTSSEQNQNPVSDSAWLNNWKFFGYESQWTSWSRLFCREYRFRRGYF